MTTRVSTVAVILAFTAANCAADPEAERRALEALREADPIVKCDETKPDKPVVSIRFRPNYGPISDNDLIQLKAFPKLRELHILNKPKVTDEGLAHLSGLEHLEVLCVNYTKVSAAGAVKFVKDRTRLRHLELSGVPLGDDDLAALKKLTELRTLHVRGTLITDKGAAHLKPFSKLQNLNLSTRDERITDAALLFVSELSDLEYLDLDRTAITDAGLMHLKSLHNLKGLQLAFTPVTDAGLEHLRGLTNLNSLNARGTRITKEGVDKLKQKNPGLQVGFGPATK